MWEVQRIVFAAGFGRMLVTHREVEEYRFPGSVKLSPSDEQDLRSADAQGRGAGGHRFTFPRSHRLTHAREFEAVYAGKLRKRAGAIALAVLPNGLSHPRLGLSIGRRFGGAVARNRLKRLLREAFRLSQHELPRVEGKPGHGGYDYVVSARAHEALTLERYRAMLMDLARACDEERRRREARHGEKFGEKGSGDA